MTPTVYQTVFKIGLGSFPWFKLLEPIMFVVLGLLISRFSGGKESSKALGLGLAILGGFAFIIVSVELVPDFVSSRRSYLGGDNLMVQGRVSEFQPMPVTGVARESFSVDGIRFSYNVLDMTPCFHDTPPHRGPIREGLYVRIYYKDGCIQRVDVRH